MAYTIKGNLDASGNVTAGGKNTIRTINNTIVADVNGNVTLDMDNFVTGNEGDVIYFDKNGDAISDRIVKYARIVDNEKDFNLEKNTILSFQTVFNSWKRISNYDTGVFPAVPSELNDWIYNNTTDQIECTINSNTLVGFVSPAKYNNYTFEVSLSSADIDDDWIGIILAYANVNGQDHTITAMRKASKADPFVPILPSTSSNLNGAGSQWDWKIIYNFAQGTAGKEYTIASGSGLTNVTSWQVGGTTKIKAVRSGNTITASTTQFATPNTYVQPLTVDLTSDPRLSVFLNPSSIGYCAFSQPKATFKNITFTGGQNIIFDSRDSKVWVYNGSTWSYDASINMYDTLSKGVIYSNINTGKSFFINGVNDCRLVGGARVSSQTGNTIQVLDDGLYVGISALSNINQYVDSINGNDSNDGSIGKPLKTIGAAMSKLVPGVKGYNIHLHNLGTYLLPNNLNTKGLGVTFWNYPAPAWVDAYVAANPYFEWMATAGIPRPIVKPDVANFTNKPGQGLSCQSLIFEQYGELAFNGCQIETGATPSGTIFRAGIFGDASQVCTLTFRWCDIKLQGLPLINERIESSTNVVFFRSIISQKAGDSLRTDPKVLNVAVSGLPSDPNTTYPEHPYFNNSTIINDIRDSIKGVKYYNGVPMNCTYPALYGGPF